LKNKGVDVPTEKRGFALEGTISVYCGGWTKGRPMPITGRSPPLREPVENADLEGRKESAKGGNVYLPSSKYSRKCNKNGQSGKGRMVGGKGSAAKSKTSQMKRGANLDRQRGKGFATCTKGETLRGKHIASDYAEKARPTPGGGTPASVLNRGNH